MAGGSWLAWVRPRAGPGGREGTLPQAPSRDSCLKGELESTVTVTLASVPDPFAVWLFLTQLVSEARLAPFSY